MDSLIKDTKIIFKTLLGLTEESISKTIYISSKNDEKIFSINLFIKILKNEIYNLSNSDDFYHDILNITNDIFYNVEETIEEDNNNDDSLNISFDIPFNEIFDKIINNNGLKEYPNIKKIIQDCNLVNDLWDNWNPNTIFFKDLKELAEQLINTFK